MKNFEAKRDAIASKIEQIAKNAVKNEILKTAELLMCSTATDEMVAEQLELLGMDRPGCRYGLVWVNAGFYDYLECIPMLTTDRGKLEIWYDGNDCIPDVKTEDEVSYMDLVHLLGLLTRKLDEVDQRDRAFWKRLRERIGDEGMEKLKEIAKGL